MKDFIKTFEGFLKKEIDYDNPRNLYEPVKYLEIYLMHYQLLQLLKFFTILLLLMMI